MITGKEKLDVKDFESMHADFYMVLAEEWTPLLVKALSGSGLKLGDTERDALSALKRWRFVADADAVAPTVFHATLNAAVKNIFQETLGDDLYGQYIKSSYMVFNAMRNMVAAGSSPWFDDPATGPEEQFADILVKSFKEAVVYLEGEMGADVENWQWGRLHTLTLYHPFGRSSRLMGRFLNIGPFPMGGSLATVNPQPYRLSKPWEGYHGASLRYIVDFADRKKSRRVIPAGISGNFMSRHYDDQAELWRTGRYRPFVLDRDSIETDKEHVLNMRAGS